mmetsp:Transcript_7913/g.28089  ORF Transcript_7913/g.28089 Transcript_7913/m.28089 type:complete len:222 (+) Transcript_7913:260-925(+)
MFFGIGSCRRNDCAKDSTGCARVRPPSSLRTRAIAASASAAAPAPGRSSAPTTAMMYRLLNAWSNRRSSMRSLKKMPPLNDRRWKNSWWPPCRVFRASLSLSYSSSSSGTSDAAATSAAPPFVWKLVSRLRSTRVARGSAIGSFAAPAAHDAARDARPEGGGRAVSDTRTRLPVLLPNKLSIMRLAPFVSRVVSVSRDAASRRCCATRRDVTAVLCALPRA